MVLGPGGLAVFVGLPTAAAAAAAWGTAPYETDTRRKESKRVAATMGVGDGGDGEGTSLSRPEAPVESKRLGRLCWSSAGWQAVTKITKRLQRGGFLSQVSSTCRPRAGHRPAWRRDDAVGTLTSARVQPWHPIACLWVINDVGAVHGRLAVLRRIFHLSSALTAARGIRARSRGPYPAPA